MTQNDLKELRVLNQRIRTIEERIDRLRASVERTSPNLDGMPHGGKRLDVMAEYAAKMDECQRTLSELAEQMKDEVLRIEDEIRTLEPREQMIMWARYVDGHSWKKIQREYHYSYIGCQKIHRKALDKLLKE